MFFFLWSAPVCTHTNEQLAVRRRLTMGPFENIPALAKSHWIDLRVCPCVCIISLIPRFHTSAQAAIRTSVLICVIKLSCHHFITSFIYFCPYRCFPLYIELFLISETDVSRDKSKVFKFDWKAPTCCTYAHMPRIILTHICCFGQLFLYRLQTAEVKFWEMERGAWAVTLLHSNLEILVALRRLISIIQHFYVFIVPYSNQICLWHVCNQISTQIGIDVCGRLFCHWCTTF